LKCINKISVWRLGGGAGLHPDPLAASNGMGREKGGTGRKWKKGRRKRWGRGVSEQRCNVPLDTL